MVWRGSRVAESPPAVLCCALPAQLCLPKPQAPWPGSACWGSSPSFNLSFSSSLGWRNTRASYGCLGKEERNWRTHEWAGGKEGSLASLSLCVTLWPLACLSALPSFPLVVSWANVGCAQLGRWSDSSGTSPKRGGGREEAGGRGAAPSASCTTPRAKWCSSLGSAGQGSSSSSSQVLQVLPS